MGQQRGWVVDGVGQCEAERWGIAEERHANSLTRTSTWQSP